MFYYMKLSIIKKPKEKNTDNYGITISQEKNKLFLSLIVTHNMKCVIKKKKYIQKYH